MYAVKRTRQRRGVVLLIVLALLGLFAAVGISFAIIARSEGRGGLAFRQKVQGYDGPSPRELLKSAMDQLIFDTNNPQSSIRGHSLLRDMYGGWDRAIRSGAAPNYIYQPAGIGAQLRQLPNGATRDYMGAFDGTGIFPPRKFLDPVTGPNPNIGQGNGVLSQAEIVEQIRRLFVPREFGALSSDPATNPLPNTKQWFPLMPYNFQRFDAIGQRTASPNIGGASPFPLTPELYAYFDAGAATWRYHWFPFDEDYDAADHNNWYLALQRADGTVIVPSFHRPHLVRQMELAGVFGNPNVFPAYTVDTLSAPENEQTGVVSGRRILFRPRVVDVDANYVLGAGLPANFPTLRDLNNNGIFGDMPEELDVDTDGDGKPDAVWVDLGVRPFRQEDGALVKPLFAFTVVAMDGKVNANLAGNFVANPNATAPQAQLGMEGHPQGHISAYGASPAEINPRHAITLDQQNTVLAANPDYDPLRGDYWPVWMQRRNLAMPPTYYDPIYLRLLLNGLPPLTGGTTMPATAANVVVPGRWTNPNAVTASFILDRPGARNSDDDGSMPHEFNANVPTEPTTGGAMNIVRGTVSSSIGPVGFQAGRRYPPFSKLAVLNLGSNVGQVFPKFVNHVHAHYRDGRSYWPGYDGASVSWPAPYSPPMAPPVIGGGTGEFDVPGSMNIPATSFAFDLRNFPASGFAPPSAVSNWFPTPGVLATNSAGFPSFLNFMQLVMTADDSNEINPYVASSTNNSLFTNAQVEQLLRFHDLNSNTLDDRMLRLLAFNLEAESRQVVGTPYQFNAVQAARERQRRMWTPESWDLIHFSNSPAFSDPANTPGAATYLPSATMLDSRNGPMPNDAAIYAYTPAIIDPPYGVLQTNNGFTQHNGLLWVPPRPTPLGTYDPAAPLGYAFAWDGAAYTSVLPSLGNELGSRYPVEVMRGRRYDLNRPLSSYESRPLLADAERTAMAQQVYVLLYLSAGLNMRPLPANLGEAREAFAQARTLAQIAVNIVDFIDPDTVMTRMRFHPFLQCPSTTTTPTGVATNAAEQWNNLEGAMVTGVTFTFGAISLPDVRTEELTVMGFEMPDLVISEGVSVTVQEAVELPPDATPEEFTFVWAELYNPWPNETDLDSGAATVHAPTPRGRLFDETPTAPVAGGRTLAQSRFILGVRQNNASGGAVPPRDPSAPPAGGDFHTLTHRYVHFAGTGMTGVTTPDGAFSTPRNTPNNGPDIRGGQRLLVEPNQFTGSIVPTEPDDPGALLVDWTPANGPNRFTCAAPTAMDRDDEGGIHDMRIVRAEVTPGDDNDANVVISLYRLRNPYVNWDATSNPYIAIDTLELRGDAAPSQPDAEGAYDLTKTTPPPIGERRSMERRQPWHGSNRPWVPYRGLTTNPNATLVDATATPPRFLEGKFLGFPYLTADATTGAVVPSFPPPPTLPAWGNQLIANGFAESTEVLRGNTLYGTAETPITPYAVNHMATQNTQDNALAANNNRYMSFPFLNRQLATPLELLSVRLYGSHVWAVPGAGPTNDREWRLRFTDDFEFRQDTANNQVGPNYPPLPPGGFNRVYRSREIPWFLNDRKLHPIDANLSFDPIPPYNPQYDPGAPAGPAASANRLAPFPNLYRFFEMVETGSRVNGAGGWGTLAASVASNTAADLRESRVAGKINLNTIPDEEIFKALFDDEAAMPFTPVGTVKHPLSPALATAPGPMSDRYRPINYPVDVVDPLYTGGVAQLVKALGWNPVTGSAELVNSAVVDVAAVNDSFVNSTVGALLPVPIDFGGFFTLTLTSFDMAPINLTLPLAGNRRLVHNQFPGVINGAAGYNGLGGIYTGLYPGWDREQQVSSELFRAFVFSRSGRDALWGTADDKPFHSYASVHLADTLLRRRNNALLDSQNSAMYGSTASPATQASTNASFGFAGAPGEYITRLGGQWTPRLFDPVPLPYTLDNGPATLAAIAPTHTRTMAHRADVPAAPAPGGAPHAVEYWMLEWRRNELLAKIASNTTTRSNVFGVWITVGYFRVEPGTENLLVPLLHEEVGSPTGTQRRHRMFAIVDRTQAKEFTELMTINPPKLEDNAIVRHYSFIE